eukprot:TRINITY_DN24462_c0_g1_i2.p1 TRINITY_DN24462_c0_g1~~TRINITY_DN24462_c0_g1_i2.p1  ORF type:complete len:207 (-),score=50.34 TRINITY_DN24462_c0_g1_i2:34-597(-)
MCIRDRSDIVDVKTRAMTIIIVLAIYYFLVSKAQPFADKTFNGLENMAFESFILTIFFALYVKDNSIPALNYVSYAVMAYVNLKFLLMLFAYFFVKTICQLMNHPAIKKISFLTATTTLIKDELQRFIPSPEEQERIKNTTEKRRVSKILARLQEIELKRKAVDADSNSTQPAITPDIILLRRSTRT